MFIYLQNQYLTDCQKQEVMNLIPAKTKATSSKTSTEHLKLTFQHYWAENKFLKEKFDELQSEIKKLPMEVSAERLH